VAVVDLVLAMKFWFTTGEAALELGSTFWRTNAALAFALFIVSVIAGAISCSNYCRFLISFIHLR